MLYSFKENVCNVSTQDPIFFKKEKKEEDKDSQNGLFQNKNC